MSALELKTDDPIAHARAAKLRYVSLETPGFTRRRRGKSFTYYDTAGTPLRDAAHLTRIRSLVIPPAWTEVWISPYSNSHLQATGRDQRGRKQYRYHPRWCAVRNETKFERMLAFGDALPRLRRRIEEDLRSPGLCREKVIAAVVRLLETTLIRIGNEEYARENESYGLTTLRNEHVEVRGAKVRFHFSGKSGVEHNISLYDSRLSRIVKACQELPGQELFEYIDDDGKLHSVSSDEVNDYLRQMTEEEFTTKDFRTWAGTLCALSIFSETGMAASATALKQNQAQALKRVAQRLGNTPAVCRKYYIHPAVLEAYRTGALPALPASCTVKETLDGADLKPVLPPSKGLFPEEKVMMEFLRSLSASSEGTL